MYAILMCRFADEGPQEFALENQESPRQGTTGTRSLGTGIWDLGGWGTRMGNGKRRRRGGGNLGVKLRTTIATHFSFLLIVLAEEAKRCYCQGAYKKEKLSKACVGPPSQSCLSIAPAKQQGGTATLSRHMNMRQKVPNGCRRVRVDSKPHRGWLRGR